MNEWKIERSHEHSFGRLQVLANSIENFISHKKHSVVTTQYLQSIKPFSLLN